MADKNSARPSGERASYARSGLTLTTLQEMGFGTSTTAFAGLFAAVMATHIVLAVFTAGDTNNTIWPTLAIGYGLLIATAVLRNQGSTFFAQRAFLRDEDIDAQTHYGETPPQRIENEDATPHASTRDAKDLAEIYRLQRQNLNRATSPSTMTASYAPNSDWSDLLSQVSHELRTPLNAMIGFSDAMNAELLGPLENPRYREYLAHIRESGQELLKSTEDTLAMTSLLASRTNFDAQAGEVHLRAAILDAWEFIAHDADSKSISLEIENIADVPIAADIRPLRQSFINLFSEAVKVAARHGEVVVDTRLVGDVVEVEIRTEMSDPPQTTLPPSLSTAIAKALLELQGTSLATVVDDAGSWVAATLFECRMQSDFFDPCDVAPHNTTQVPH